MAQNGGGLGGVPGYGALEEDDSETWDTRAHGDATTSWTKSPELVKVAERAKRHSEQRILVLAHLIDEPALLGSMSDSMIH